MRTMNNFSSYLSSLNLTNFNIDYTWDDTKPEEILDYDYANTIFDKIETISWRSKAILLTGIYEWIYSRLSYYHKNDIFYQMIDAAYTATINHFYLISIYDLDSLDNVRNNFIGPIEGVLWCAGYSSLLSCFYINDGSIDLESSASEDHGDSYTIYKIDDDLIYNIALAQHILPLEIRPLFEGWLEGVINRLIKYYVMPKKDPLDNLFGYKDNKNWLGDYVSREVLDLDYPYNLQDAVKLCNQFLQQVDYRNNPLLVPPEQLTGKIKQPYRLIE